MTPRLLRWLSKYLSNVRSSTTTYLTLPAKSLSLHVPPFQVLFDEVQIFDPNGPNLVVSKSPSKAGAKSKSKAKSVSVSSLTEALETEPDPVKRELVTLVLQWLDAKAVARRGGFKASGTPVSDSVLSISLQWRYLAHSPCDVQQHHVIVPYFASATLVVLSLWI